MKIEDNQEIQIDQCLTFYVTQFLPEILCHCLYSALQNILSLGKTCRLDWLLLVKIKCACAKKMGDLLILFGPQNIMKGNFYILYCVYGLRPLYSAIYLVVSNDSLFR